MDLQRIVIGVDFSPASTEATRWAAQHFERGVELILAHALVAPDLDSGHDRRDLMVDTRAESTRKRLQDLADSISVESVRFDVREGNAARALADASTEHNADLLIVGASGEHAGIARPLGTTAQHAVMESAVPVLVVVRLGRNPISQILVPVDEDSTARESLHWAALFSERFTAKVTTLHVARADDAGDNSDRWIELALASGIARDRVTSEEVSGVPAVEILSASQRNAADIIVMGRRTPRSLRRAVLGSVTATVLSDPPCSVLVVPAS